MRRSAKMFMNCHPEPSGGEAEDERGICSLPASKRTADSSSLSLLGMTIRLFVCLIVLSVSGYSEERTCSTAKAQQADAGVDRLHSWDAFYKWFSVYRHCDDGGIAEGVSEAVARNLVDRWETLPRLAELARKTPEFRRFVFQHVDATLDSKDLDKIQSNAAKRCPTDLTAFCSELKKKVVQAKAEG